MATRPNLFDIGYDEGGPWRSTDGGCWAIYFHRVLLATLDECDYIIQS